MADRAFSRLSKSEKDEVIREFIQYDTNKDGTITFDEAHAILAGKFNFPENLTQKLMELCDTNNDGHLSYMEFVEFYFKAKEKLSKINKLVANEDENGCVGLQEVKDAIKHVGFNDAEIETLVSTYPVDKHGRIQYEDFLKYWHLE